MFAESRPRSMWIAGSILSLLLVMTGCQQLTPEQELEAIRSQYEVEFIGFRVEDVMPAGMEDEMPAGMEDEMAAGTEDEMPEGTEEGASEEDAATDEESTDEEGTDAAEGAETDVDLQQNAYLDVLVKTDAFDTLDGITVDVSQGDPQGNEKAQWKIWVDTSQVQRGVGAQKTLEIEDVDFSEGDGFAVEVRSPVPDAERSEYREFDSIGGE